MTSLGRKITLLTGDWLIFYLSLLLGLSLRQFDLVGAGFFFQHLVVFSGIFPLWLAVFYTLELYDLKKTYSLIDTIASQVMALLVNLGLSVGYFYLFSIQLGMTPKTNLILMALIAHAASLLWRRLLVYMIWPKLPGLRVAFWGDNPLFERMARDLRLNANHGYNPVARQSMGDFSTLTSIDDYWRSERKDALRLKNYLDLIVVDSQQVEEQPLRGQTMLSIAIMEEIAIRTHLDFYEEIYQQIPPDFAARSYWLLSHVLHQRKRPALMIKRFIDIAGALAGLIALSPLLLAIALILKLLDRAQPFYTQSRVGYHGKEFMIWKFRTMVPDAEKRGPLYTPTAADGDVTRCGAFLRRFRLDELPQLWNVLKGDMSLVGPRPEWTSEVRILEKNVPHYHLRHLVKPGITGWAQINFRATASASDSLEKLHYDLFYVKNLSLALDLGILLKTSKRVFQAEDGFVRLAPPV